LADKIFTGNQRLKLPANNISGRLLFIDGTEYYLIENYDLMKPFLMAVVSNSDHWMYISSTGGLTAGRKNPDNAIFPYYTDDKIHLSYTSTGSKTIILAGSGDKKFLWKPFSDHYRGIYSIKRNLYKNTIGNRLMFEERNEDLRLVFRYTWMNSERYGWIKKSSLINESEQDISLSVLDGIANILPYGVNQMMQTNMSTLVDAYKKNELDTDTGLGVFRLSSIPVDRAVPSEALKCTSVWSAGYKPASVLLSSRQVDKFAEGEHPVTETESKALKGCYFTVANLLLEASGSADNYYVIELEQDSSDVEKLIYLLENENNPDTMLEEDVARGSSQLADLVGKADGHQLTADRMTGVRHFSNVLFNCMRGGLFENDYEIKKEYFGRHIRRFNKKIWLKHAGWLENLPGILNLDQLMNGVKDTADSDLLRLAYEYLPLSFSRRHGDPSRPWNRFDIRLKEEDGSLSYSYQGNWRDIFQNWEALALSYPGFLSSMISRFLNSSNPHGYNPYRISSEGIDWEVPEKDNPWAHIGYWGDHQIIYLLRLLELVREFKPGQLDEWLDLRIFSYANIPYTIKEYDDIIKNPYETIVFDEEKNGLIEKLSADIGADGKMVMDNDGQVVKASFTEKILVNILARLVNFIPGAGIWMNTQRPEWNDANNALVGNGASMVTLYYLRRMVNFLRELYGNADRQIYLVREEVFKLFELVFDIMLENKEYLNVSPDDKTRRLISDQLGRAGSDYRQNTAKGFSGRFLNIRAGRLSAFLELVSGYIDSSISLNRRSDGLYNAYNLVSHKNSEISIIPLQKMLEGQVAALSSGILQPQQAVTLIADLYESDLYRADQDSFMLYPDRQLKSFRAINNLDDSDISGSLLLKKLLAEGDTSIIQKDIKGKYHFNGRFTRAEDLKMALDGLPPHYAPLAEKEKELIAGIFESVFNHKMFTGRSGSFYKYEGLGSIYWHMVSKMLLAVAEYIVRADNEKADKKVLERLICYYYRLRSGIGAGKSPSEYGAIPSDPYSHTPMKMGVQQPGMTGQVKEDIISRSVETGIRISEGRLSFRPVLLRRQEFLKDENGGEYFEFTFCQTPVRYIIGEKQSLQIILSTGEVRQYDEQSLNFELSRSLFMRTGMIKYIMINIKEQQLLKL